MAQSVTAFDERTDAGQAPPGPAPISGGHLVAEALRAQGADAISALRGGHVIDISDHPARISGCRTQLSPVPTSALS